MEYQKDFYQRGHEDMSKGKTAKAKSGQGNTTAKGTFTPDIDFEKLYGATTPAVDTQFINSIVTESAGLPTAAPKTGKGKKSY